MNVEEIAENDPDALVQRHIDPRTGLSVDEAGQLAVDAGIDEDVVDGVAEILVKLNEAFDTYDATLIEVNPLIVTGSRDVVALDAKVTIDNSALFRHEDIAGFENPHDDDPQEQMAKEKGLTYVKLDGNVGILGNGAGLCMSTLDVVANAGGKPANFLDAGGGSKADAIVDALEVITSDEKVTAVLFNIFGGITRCDEVAKGIIEAYARVDMDVPLVVRLDGTNSEEGLRLLEEANLEGLEVNGTMLGAAERVVELAGATDVDHRRDRHEARRQRPDRPRGSPSTASATATTALTVAGVTLEEGRPRSTACRSSTRSRRRSTSAAPTPR